MDYSEYFLSSFFKEKVLSEYLREYYRICAESSQRDGTFIEKGIEEVGERMISETSHCGEDFSCCRNVKELLLWGGSKIF